MGNLIERINKAIDTEYDSKNKEVDDLLLLPVEERVLKGDTISNLKAQFIESSSDYESDVIYFTRVKITCKDNISKFREGSPVCLTGHGYVFSLDVIQDNGEEMILEMGWGSGIIPSGLNNTAGWILDNAKVDIRNIVKKTTTILTANKAKHEYLNGIFKGTIHPSFSESRAIKAKQLVDKMDLNDTQKKAFVYAYSTNNYYLIQGPPGTGKTWLLAHLAYELAKEGKKVLITANTHTAINNALQKTSLLSKYPHIIKVGKSFQKENLNDNGSTAKNVTDFSRSGYNNESRGIIVGATCYAPLTKKLEFMNWDIVLVDEAGQLSIPLAFAGMIKGEKFIFIGDHKQLPPILSDQSDDPEFSKSIFEHLFKFTSGIMLDITYRMNKIINHFPASKFYGGKLYPHSENENWILNIPNNFKRHFEILDKNKPEVLYCHYHQSIHARSEHEAQIIAEFVDEYIHQGILSEDIAIITPFRAQVRLIKKHLSNLPNYLSIKDKLFVDTIERIQGQERDIIIYSLATSDPVKAKQRAEFFFNPNRLNVALTRAKKKRIVLGNNSLFNITIDDKTLKPLIQNFKDFYNATTKIFESADNKDLY